MKVVTVPQTLDAAREGQKENLEEMRFAKVPTPPAWEGWRKTNGTVKSKGKLLDQESSAALKLFLTLQSHSHTGLCQDNCLMLSLGVIPTASGLAKLAPSCHLQRQV